MIDYQKAVKDLRDKLIMTQAEFANMLGVSFTSINRYLELGEASLGNEESLEEYKND